MGADDHRPDEDDIPVHRYDVGDHSEAWFSLGTGHGTGEPWWYICLDENGGERSWWFGRGKRE